jgi:hypothetical protein
MAHKFNKGDLVTVTTKNSIYEGARGRVERSQDDDTYLITLETGKISGFFERELEVVDEEKEALIRLAETLDSARQQANAIKATEGDVYGKISEALSSTLESYFYQSGKHAFYGEHAYGEIIRSGFSVREAIKYVEDNK